MKHSLRVTIWLILFFLISQIIGLSIIANYISIENVAYVDSTTNETTYIKETVALDLPNQIERPMFDTSLAFISYLIIAIILATMLFLFLVKLKTFMIWKLWFFFAVFLCLTISFAAFMPQLIATLIGLFLGLWKIFKPNIFVHNFTELFIYGGLAAILVPISIVNEYVMIIVLVLMSIYDAYAVWKSKHMVKMAQFQAKSKVFAGLLVPYAKEKKFKISKNIKKSSLKGKVKFKGIKTAILGGGDIAFPLLFSGAVLKSMVLLDGFVLGFLKTLIVTLFTAFALTWLFLKGREDRFYPALPFLTVGCLIGYGVLLLINFVL
jgi:presenilin-like A22 family membrane protease